MGNFRLNSIKNNSFNQNLLGHLGHFGPDSNFHNYYNPKVAQSGPDGPSRFWLGKLFFIEFDLKWPR